MSLILVNATLSFATCMLTESSLSYMGFGIAPPTPTWGNMLTGAHCSFCSCGLSAAKGDV